MRKKLVIGNWKMNLSQAGAVSAVDSLIHKVSNLDSVEVAVCPPYLSLAKVREALRRTNIELGAQDVFWVDSGAFTGRVSAPMLADAGVRICIVGHSETRGKFGKLEVPEDTVSHFAETDRTVNLKVHALLYHHIVPVLCVGETLSEREQARTDEVIRGQVAGGLKDVDASEFNEGVVAYEPVWAIGTGRTCDATEANRVCGMIRGCLGEVLDGQASEAVRVLYGGSVKSANAAELFRQTDIDGGLVGGASLDPEEFSKIVRSAA